MQPLFMLSTVYSTDELHVQLKPHAIKSAPISESEKIYQDLHYGSAQLSQHISDL